MKLVGTPKELIPKMLNLPEDKKYELKELKEKRSLNANDYCWVLCTEMAKVLRSTKEEIYKQMIREVGQYEILPIKDEAVEDFISKWTSRGIGWVCEKFGDSKLKGYTKVVAYFGSSSYNTKEMSILIDNIVQEAQRIGVETKTPEEIARLKSLWESKRE